jgi:hypothetical protein
MANLDDIEIKKTGDTTRATWPQIEPIKVLYPLVEG